MKTLTITAALAASLMFAAVPASADSELVARHAVPGEKLDSGLGEIAPYRAPVAGQKLDSGLGDLPHYRDWADKTGKAPVRAEQVAAVSVERK